MVDGSRTLAREARLIGWRVRAILAALLGIVLTMTGLGLGVVPAHAADFKLGIDKSIDDPQTSYDVGDTVSYRIRVKCDSLTAPCQTANVQDVLDPNLTYGSYSITRLGTGEDASTAPISLKQTGQTLDFTVGDASDPAKYFQDGETLELVVTTTITGVPSNAGSTIANQATITASDEVNVSDPVTITVNKPVIDWKLRKTRIWPPAAIDPAVGGEVTYQLQFYRDKSTGGVPIDSAVLTDTLPSGAQFVKAWADYPSLTGVHSGDKVTFTLPANTDLSPKGNSFSAYVTVSYPAGSAGETITNNASADVTYDTGEATLPTGTLTASADVTLADPKGSSYSQKWSNLSSPASPGGSVTWTVQGHNTGNVALGTYVATDHLPDGIHDVQLVASDGWWMPTSASSQKVTFEYSTDGTTWSDGFTWTNGQTNATQDVPAGVKYVRMTSPNLPIDGYTGFQVKAVVDDGASGALNNCMDVTGDGTAQNVCSNNTVEPKAVRVFPSKSHFYKDDDGNVISASSASPGDTLEWVLSVNTNSSLPVDKLTITDLLPKEFELVTEDKPCLDYRASWASATSGCNADATYPAYTTEVQGDGSTKITFADPKLPSVSQNDSTYQIHLNVRVKDGTLAGDYANTMTVTPDGFTSTYCSWDATKDADNACPATDTVTVAKVAGVGIQKWDIGTRENVSQTTGKASASCPDWNGYTRYPCVAQTTPGGSFGYRVKIANQGNVNLTNEVAYDILPYVGDTGVGQNLSTSDRKSEWVPVLDGPITLNASLTTATGHNAVVEYNLTSNPCRPELAEGTDSDWQSGNCDNTWYTESQITDWSTVKSYRIKAYQAANSVWAPATRLVFDVPMKAPADSPKSSIVGSKVDLSVAWNSVSQRSFQVNTNGTTTRLLPTEPRKVGIIIAAPLVSIGDYVWYDANYNGKQDASEKPASGVKVTLKDADGNTVATTTTDADGYYGFADLPEKTAYTLTFTAPSGYEWTRRDKGTDDAIDSDVNPATGQISFTTPAWSDTSKNTIGHDVADDPTLDGGLITPRPMVSVGDYTWYDSDRDGIQDAGEPVASGVTVNLYDADGELVDTTTTDSDGYYAFTDLGEDEQYTIEFIRPTGAVFTKADAGGNTSNSASTDLTDSDAPADGANLGKVTFTSASSGTNLGGHDKADNPGIDAGFIAYNLSLKKTLDTPGLVRLGDTVTFTLTPHNDGPVQALAGWSVSEVLPLQSGLTFVSMTGAAADYDCTTTVGTCVGKAALGRGADGSPITVTATVDASATGTLKNVAYVSPAASDIAEKNPLVVPTVATDTASTGTDNDAQASVLVSPLVSIGDYVWYDANRDGLQSPGEKPYAGMTVNLLDSDGALLRTTTTDADGYYAFGNLEASTGYTVEFVKKSGETFTTRNASGVTDNNLTTDANDSDANLTTGRAAVTTPATGANRTGHNQADNPTIDAGVLAYNLKLAKSLTTAGPFYEGRTVTFRLVPSNDGPVEALAGWSVTDVLPSGLTLVSMTGDGYTCTGATCTASAALAAGASGAPITVTAAIDASFVGTVHNVAYVAPASGDLTETNVLAVPTKSTDTDSTATDNDAQASLTVDSLVSIGDYVWYDDNRDGAQGAHEDPVSGVTVNLYAADGSTLLKTTKTDADGFYSFTGLVPNEHYVVEFVKPAHTAFTEQKKSGVDVALDSNANVATGRVDVTAPASGKNSATKPDDPTIDAGLVKLVSVGDFVWLDNNRNGTPDGNEPAEPGVTVQLFDQSGTLVATTVTDANGYYGFGDVLPSEPYRIHFVAPDGYSFTGQNLVADDADSDADLNGDVRFTTPAKGSNVVSPRSADDPTIDAGLVRFNLSVVKSLITTGTVNVGDTVTYRLVPHNDGPSDALAGWTVTDVLPSRLSLVSMTGDGYTCTANACVAKAPLAAASDGPVITVVATVRSGSDSKVWNVAYVAPATGDANESNPLGSSPTTDTDTATTSTDNDDQVVLLVKTTSELAYTGADGIGATVALGLVLAAGGALLLVLRRRRREA